MKPPSVLYSTWYSPVPPTIKPIGSAHCLFGSWTAGIMDGILVDWKLNVTNK